MAREINQNCVTQGVKCFFLNKVTEILCYMLGVCCVFLFYRMASCGWGNVRFWRVKDGSLRSCPVALPNHHQSLFRDVLFHTAEYSGDCEEPCNSV